MVGGRLLWPACWQRRGAVSLASLPPWQERRSARPHMSVHARLCVCCAWERDTLRGHASAYVSVWKGGKAGHLWDWCSPLSPRACDADGASQRNEYINYKRKRAPRPSIGYSPGSPKRSPNDLANDAKVLPVTGRSASCSAPLHPPLTPRSPPGLSGSQKVLHFTT